MSGVSMATALCLSVPFHYPPSRFPVSAALSRAAFLPDSPLCLSLFISPLPQLALVPGGYLTNGAPSQYPKCFRVVGVVQEIAPGPVRSRERGGLFRH